MHVAFGMYPGTLIYQPINGTDIPRNGASSTQSRATWSLAGGGNVGLGFGGIYIYALQATSSATSPLSSYPQPHLADNFNCLGTISIIGMTSSLLLGLICAGTYLLVQFARMVRTGIKLKADAWIFIAQSYVVVLFSC
jgi:hypothetical protein